MNHLIAVRAGLITQALAVALLTVAFTAPVRACPELTKCVHGRRFPAGWSDYHGYHGRGDAVLRDLIADGKLRKRRRTQRERQV